jgi:hypothetical protein
LISAVFDAITYLCLGGEPLLCLTYRWTYFGAFVRFTLLLLCFRKLGFMEKRLTVQAASLFASKLKTSKLQIEL